MFRGWKGKLWTGRKYSQTTYPRNTPMRVYTELSKSNSGKTNSPIREWTKDMNRYFTKKDTHMTKKKAHENCSPLGKCQLKPQWDINIQLAEWRKLTHTYIHTQRESSLQNTALYNGMMGDRSAPKVWAQRKYNDFLTKC